MNEEKYLPVGTVVMLKNGKKRVMITGFCAVSKDYGDTVFDYCGCLYPEGYVSSDESLLFNHEQINNFFHMGLIDEEEKDFKSKLKAILNNLTDNNN